MFRPVSLMLGCSGALFALGCGSGISAPIKTISMSLTPSASSLYLGQTAILVPSFSDAVARAVTWSASSASLTVQSGQVACSAPGAFQATATSGSISSSAAITCVESMPSSISFVAQPAMVRSETSFQYQVKATYADGTTQDVTSKAAWTTNSASAAVSATGLLSCNLYGPTTISAKVSGLVVSTSTTCILKTIASLAGFAEKSMTFDGPFASWVNLKNTFGAKGDGVTDDTTAIQNALTSLKTSSAVLWLPRGRYVITQPLTLSSGQDFSIIGEDPATTSIVWAGALGQTMLTLDGCTGFKMTRITWDGGSLAGTDIAVLWTGLPGQYYPTRDIIGDSRIVNAATGLRVGEAGETTIERVHFDHDTVAAISLTNFNALNFNVIDSLFTDCGYGVTNTFGAGAFNVYNSVFVRSTVSDLGIGNTGPFSFRSNISFHSTQFITESTIGCAANTVIEGNVIVATSLDPIAIRDPGPILLVDNQFLQFSSQTHILYTQGTPLGLVAVGNTYTVTTPYTGGIKYLSVLDEAAYTADVAATPSIPLETYVPAQSGRTIYDLPAHSSSGAIQAAIDSAIRAGQGVVHLQAGYYPVDTTVQVTSSADIAVIGDGTLTALVGSALLVGPVLQSTGTHFQMNDIALEAFSASSIDAALRLKVPDTPSTHFICDECSTAGATSVGFEDDGLDNVSVAFSASLLNSAAATSWSANILGGPQRKLGKEAFGQTRMFMVSADTYKVSQGAHVFLTDGWHDGGQGPTQFLATGSGALTHQGGAIYLDTPGAAGMKTEGFTGTINLLGVSTNSVVATDTQSTGTLSVGSSVQIQGENPLASVGLNVNVNQMQSFLSGNNSGLDGIVPGGSMSAGTLEAMFAMSRTEYSLPRLPLSANAAGVRLTRIYLANSSVGMQLAPATPDADSSGYTIVPQAAGQSAGVCQTGELSISGTWTLAAGQDGFVGLTRNGTYLSEGSSYLPGQNALAEKPAMSSALDRWLVNDLGDGSVSFVNRATGDLLTAAADGCAYAAVGGSNNKSWVVNLARP